MQLFYGGKGRVEGHEERELEKERSEEYLWTAGIGYSADLKAHSLLMFVQNLSVCWPMHLPLFLSPSSPLSVYLSLSAL